MGSDDELGHTEVDPASKVKERTSTATIGSHVGRYVIERELGAGGMGVVYAALDPDLERRVALKVLRDGIPREAEQRLLREARAMARLTHPNVVTVYEVGSFRGRDFIAMELIDGEPLVDWLRAEPRSEAETIAAMVAAGRGLAAAHAAGIVHRDFKPHNVLRSAKGRIAVTDFGLAREAHDPLAITVPTVKGNASRNTPSKLSGLTETGDLLGTPAYMAPEQWTGGRITPATDQFAYCVALWEALAGARPFSGATPEALYEAITRGPASLDATKIPRRLRPVLLRGLDTDPAKRWPSMNALLARLERRRRGLAVAVVAIAAAGMTTAILLALRPSAESVAVTEPCEAPPIDPAHVFSPERAAKIDTPNAQSPAYFRAALASWQREREAACARSPATRLASIECLDRVLLRIDAVVRAKLLDVTRPSEVVWRSLVDPKVCRGDSPPRLPASYSPDHVVAFALRAEAKLAPEIVARVRAAAASAPCVRATLALGSTPWNELLAARDAADTCGDDAALAELQALVYSGVASGFLPGDPIAARREAERALERADHAPAAQLLHIRKAEVARGANDIDEAVASMDAAIAIEPAEAGPLRIQRVMDLLVRRRAADLQAARGDLAKWADDIEAHGLGPTAEWLDASAAWWQGDLAPAHARLIEFHRREPPRLAYAGALTGTVVDSAGRPAAGASVAVGALVVGDSIGVALPLYDSLGLHRRFELTRADERGAFALHHVPPGRGVIVAKRGRERGVVVLPTKDATVRLEATSTISGRVDRGGRAAALDAYAMRVGGLATIKAPVLADGTFQIDEVPRGELVIGINEDGEHALSGFAVQRVVRVGARPIDKVSFELPTTRAVNILVRPQQSVRAMIYVMILSGSHDLASADVVMDQVARVEQVASQLARPMVTPDPESAPLFRPGDMIARFRKAPVGITTVCAGYLPVSPDQVAEELVWRCDRLPPNAAVALVDLTR